MKDLNLMVTLWPTFPHFSKFAQDHRLSGIRLNSAMIQVNELAKELETGLAVPDAVPLFFDIKGKQLRVVEAGTDPHHLEIVLNHPIQVQTPVGVLFKAESDFALCVEVTDGGKRLIFQDGPNYLVKPGESIHIRHPTLKVGGPTFTPHEIEKIEVVRKHGITNWFLSYVESQQHVDEFRELIGPDANLVLKIESQRGLNYVANDFKKKDNLGLMAARGDLYIEVDKPHDALNALKLIASKDPQAYAGSRFLLSMMKGPVPELADFTDMAWMYDLGYRTIMLCDELCLKDDSLSRATNALAAFKKSYVPEQHQEAEPPKRKRWWEWDIFNGLKEQ